MSKTSIEWTKGEDGSAGMVWNPVSGCTKVSQGCKHCYAERVFPRVYSRDVVMLDRQKTSEPFEQASRPRRFIDVWCHPERLDAPLRWRKPRRIFVNSMSDLFHQDVQDDFIGQVFYVMAHAERHTFQILTKRPERMERWFNEFIWRKANLRSEDHPKPMFFGRPWPLPNVWLGVSVEDQEAADERIPLLLQTPAAVRFISAEPLLDGIDITEWLRWKPLATDARPPLNWVIAGGESGPDARPSHPDWFRSLRDQCCAAGVPFFMKQMGGHPNKRGALNDLPVDLRIREFPTP